MGRPKNGEFCFEVEDCEILGFPLLVHAQIGLKVNPQQSARILDLGDWSKHAREREHLIEAALTCAFGEPAVQLGPIRNKGSVYPKKISHHDLLVGAMTPESDKDQALVVVSVGFFSAELELGEIDSFIRSVPGLLSGNGICGRVYDATVMKRVKTVDPGLLDS